MTEKSVPVQNPRYEGATPEMVGLALLKHKPPPQSEKKPPAQRNDMERRVQKSLPRQG